MTSSQDAGPSTGANATAASVSMSKGEMNAYEAVLRMCADAAPNAWHPRQYARRSGMPLEQINGVLSEMWEEGLLEKAPPHPEHGPGLRLSAKGWQVFNDPKALQRLRDGVAVDAGERAEQIRKVLRQQGPSHVSRVLIGMNVLVFLYGLYLANKDNIAKEYLSGQSNLVKVDAVLHQIGALSALDWLHGDWWRTLTSCFVHIGFLHIAMNMYMLYSSGRYIERIWGPVRFLMIYLLAGVTGGLTGVAGNPGGVAGASGALFGIFAAEAVWVLFNGKYLPKQVARDWRNHLLVNAMLLAFISFLPGISGWGHAGGAAAGAAAAVCLHYQRFGLPLWRWAALLGLLPIPFGGLYMLDRERHTKETWGKAELLNFNDEYKHSLDEPITEKMRTAFDDKVRLVLGMNAERREKPETDAALKVVTEQRQELQSWQAQLQALGPYINDKVKTARENQQRALDALKARLELYDLAERSLREGEKFPKKDDKALMELIAATPELQTNEDRHAANLRKRDEERQEREKRDKEEEEELRLANEKRKKEEEEERKKEEEHPSEATKFAKEYRPKIKEPLNTTYNWFMGKGPWYDLNRNPKEWVPETVKKNLGLIDTHRKELDELTKWLSTVGPFESDKLTKEVKCAGAYAAELSKLLEMAKSGLQAGEKLTEEDKTALKEQKEKVTKLRDAWVLAMP